ncbi:MAG TPA: MFS transporter [Propionibacteriaceae bacterium]|nr:MFS transporter [Propionibacteriaceae bacterium]
MNRPLALLVAGTFFMENLDGTIIATAAPAIANDLRVAPVDVNAAMTGYLIAVAVGLPISGWLTDRFGARRILLVAIALFTVASALCALSVDLRMLVGARILQGIGGALMVPVGRLAVLRVTAKSDMIDAIAYLTWPALLAPVIAPVLGGWIVTIATWHWIFLINIPLGVLAFIVAARIVPASRAAVPPLDLVGFLLCAGTLASLLIAIEVARPSASHGVNVWLLIGTPAVVLLSLATWLWFRRTPHPLLRFEALRVPSFRVTNIGGSVYRMIISAVPFLLPLMLQLEFGWSAVRAGFFVLLLFAGNIGVKPATTPLLRRLGFRTVLIGSILGGALALVVIAFLDGTTPTWLTAMILVASGAFRSIGFSAYNSLQFADIDAAGLADANTLSSTLSQVAAGLGVAVGALLLRLSGEALRTPDSGPLTAYGLTFVLLAVILMQPLVQALRLSRTAGDELTRR